MQRKGSINVLSETLSYVYVFNYPEVSKFSKTEPLQKITLPLYLKQQTMTSLNS